ncbi:thymidine kinase [Kineosporia rhizophila]|uniref:thymidine kinase n=1 Tax=Kineosporia TaxID=49184 RepID=UPI000A549D08|nr:thymidine kinase [Kineosporia sp. NBRC 101677]MCE0536389.1 thymidine kinase [Kineosporia rhizophila]GLY15519.1 thymidine kinase [Kineosporia sp. NBRC 101677]
MPELVFFSGTMDCGKSTVALQTDHNHRIRGRQGLLFSRFDRSGEAVISSRIGLSRAANEVHDETDLHALVTARIGAGHPVDYVVCDEAHFYTPEHVEQLALLVDDHGVDVFAFGLMSDFRTRLFPASARFVELADRIVGSQAEALCWCGARATHNARTVDGVMVVAGQQVVVGDVSAGATGAVAYEVLCRRHHMRRQTVATSASLDLREPRTTV